MSYYYPATVPPTYISPSVVITPALVYVDPGHHHDTAKGAASGAAAGIFIPIIGPIIGGAIGAGVGHHKKRKHQARVLSHWRH